LFKLKDLFQYTVSDIIHRRTLYIFRNILYEKANAIGHGSGESVSGYYSIRTKQTYIGWIKRFILYHNKTHANALGPEKIGEYLNYLAVKRHINASTQNQA